MPSEIRGSDNFNSDSLSNLGKTLQQVQTAIVNYITVNSSSWYPVVSVTITVGQGATVFVSSGGEQNTESGSWQWHQLFRGSTPLGTTGISVEGTGSNEEYNYTYWDTGLAAGTYTYHFKAKNGNGYMSYGEHSDPIIQVVEFN